MAVGGVVQAVLQRSGGAEVATLAALLPHWPTLVPSLHRWCWPVGLQRGVLAVAVANDSVRQQLHYEGPGILGMLSVVLGQGRVQSLRFVAGTARPAPPAAHVPSSATPQGVAHAQQLCQSVADAELQQALTALGAHLLHASK